MNRRYRKTIIAGNWKMNKTATEAKKFADDFKALLPKTKWCDVVVCVPSVDISAAVRHHDRNHLLGEIHGAAEVQVKYFIEVVNIQFLDTQVTFWVGSAYVVNQYVHLSVLFHCKVNQLKARLLLEQLYRYIQRHRYVPKHCNCSNTSVRIQRAYKQNQKNEIRLS